MADGFIQVADDSTGKKLQTFENTISGEDVHAEAVVLVDSSGNYLSTLPVSVSSNVNVVLGATITTKETQPTTGTQSTVANSTANVTLLSSNTNRRMATVYNDDTAAFLYVRLGATASTTNFTIKMAPGSYYELPYPCYTGQIDAVASANTGNARITELT